MIRFLHAADLHLDSPFKGITDMPASQLAELRESTFNAFENLIAYAEKVCPDFVLLVGDIYDGEDRSLRAQMRFVKGLERLNKVQVPVFISYGNHDHLAGSWARFQLPENVTVFGPEVSSFFLSVRGRRVAIHGFSYRERHIEEAMISHYPEANRHDETIHIGMLHGSIAGDETHAVYAPFTKEALLKKGYDYWALGHIHKKQTLHMDPPIVYPGNLQGRHRNEQGIKGFYDVSIGEGDPSLTFVPASKLVFEEIIIDCSKIQHANDWLERCQELANKKIENGGRLILRVINTNIHTEAQRLFAGSPSEEWLDVLRESSNENVWFAQLYFDESSSSTLHHESPLTRSVKERIDNWTSEEWKIIVEDVFQHARSAHYLQKLDDEAREQLKETASAFISKELTL